MVQIHVPQNPKASFKLEHMNQKMIYIHNLAN